MGGCSNRSTKIRRPGNESRGQCGGSNIPSGARLPRILWIHPSCRRGGGPSGGSPRSVPDSSSAQMPKRRPSETWLRWSSTTIEGRRPPWNIIYLPASPADTPASPWEDYNYKPPGQVAGSNPRHTREMVVAGDPYTLWSLTNRRTTFPEFTTCPKDMCRRPSGDPTRSELCVRDLRFRLVTLTSIAKTTSHTPDKGHD